MFSDFPREIEEEILSRVPIESLRRLRATGRRWYHHPLFKDPSFIKRYFEKTARQYHKAIVLYDFKIQSMSSYVDRRRVNPSRFLLTDPLSDEKVEIAQAFHCDGVLLCTTTAEDKRFVAWSPFTGQTRWIQPPNHHMKSDLYALGYDNKQLCHSYKILRFNEKQTVEIYELKSDSWRSLDGVSPGGSFDSLGVSLKGNSYWISRRGGAKEYSLLEFDYSSERFQNLYLPFHERECLGPFALKEGLKNVALSVVKEDRLCLLYESKEKAKVEIWMRREIGDENASVSFSWSKYLAVHATPQLSSCVSFFIDEEMKLATVFYNYGHHAKFMIFGDPAVIKASLLADGIKFLEDGYKCFGWHPNTECGPIVFGYLPWLV